MLQAWLPSVSAVTAAMPEEGAQLVQCMRSAGEAFLQGLMRLSLALGTRLDALKQLQGSAAYLSGKSAGLLAGVLPCSSNQVT